MYGVKKPESVEKAGQNSSGSTAVDGSTGVYSGPEHDDRSSPAEKGGDVRGQQNGSLDGHQ